MLLEEEMRQAVQFCAWKVKWWEKQGHHRTSNASIPLHLAEGITAYAAENAATERRRLTSWASSWLAIQQQAQLVLEKYLKDQEDTTNVTVLEVEVEGDDDDDDEFPFNFDE